MRAVRSVGLLIAFGAGIRIGAAFFDLIPESVEHLGSLEMAMVATAVGFLAFPAIEKLTTSTSGTRPRLSSTTGRRPIATSACWARSA